MNLGRAADEADLGVNGGVGRNLEERLKALAPRLCRGVNVRDWTDFADEMAAVGGLIARGIREHFKEDGGVVSP